jgi:anaerobic magnesium-protoporphyrin IX monomethyl ester cyclase
MITLEENCADKLTILFVNPVLGKEKAVTPPWGMLFVLAYARERRPRHTYHFLDFNVTKPDLEAQKKILRRIRPDLIGMYSTSNYLDSCLNLARLAKETVPGCRVILGGHHVTARPYDPYPAVDCVVLGEGEAAFVDLLDLQTAGRPLPKTHRSTEFLKDIDFTPAWDLVDIRAYHPESASYFKYRPQAWITASRGCPFNCTFCGSVVYRDSNPRHRRRSPSHVIDEISHLHREHQIQSFFFTDDEVNIQVPWLSEICDLILRRNLQIRWAAQFRANPPLLPEWLVAKMWESGCRAAGIGMESGSSEVLKHIRKQTAVEDNLRAAHLFKKYAIILHGCFMIGNVWADAEGKPDGESYEQIQQTRRFIHQLLNEGLLTSMSVSIASPLPGSPMEKLLRENGLLYLNDHSSWNAQAIQRQALTFHHPRLSEAQIQETYEAIWRGATFNPRLIRRRMSMISSWADAFDFIRNGIYVIHKVAQGIGRLRHVRHNGDASARLHMPSRGR